MLESPSGISANYFKILNKRIVSKFAIRHIVKAFCMIAVRNETFIHLQMEFQIVK